MARIQFEFLIDVTIVVPGIPSEEALGAIVIGGNIGIPGIPSEEALGTPQVNLTLYVPGIPSEEALGAVSVVFDVGIPGIPSEEALGTPQLNLTLHIPGIVSQEALGAVSVGMSIIIPGIPSEEALGAVSVEEALGIPGIPSEESLGFVRVRNLGLVSQGAFSGTIDGGASITLIAGNLDTTGCSDFFTSGTINLGFWTVLDAGGGVTSPTVGSMRMDTGATPGGVAGLRTVATATNLDLEVDFVPVLFDLPGTATCIVDTALIETPGVSELHVRLEQSRGGLVLRLLVFSQGLTVVNQVAFLGPVMGATTVRLVRIGARTIALVNGTPYLDVIWSAGAAAMEFFVANDAVLTSRALVAATRFQRWPAIAFDAEPVLGYEGRSPDVVVAKSPKVATPRVSTIFAYGCTSTQTVPMGFTYVLGDRRVIGKDSVAELIVLNDPALKET